MRIVCLSDTHTFGNKITVPDGDVVVHAGDHTFNGRRAQVEKAFRWFAHLPHRHKVAIAGNHDFFCEESSFKRWLRRFYPAVTYLQDSAAEIEGVKFYGSPWQPWFHDWAFNFLPGNDGRTQAREKWSHIPEDTDVLITHGPPYGVLDALHGKVNDWDNRAGCPDLRYRVTQIRPKLHVFGHIHEGYGMLEEGDIKFVNAAICTRAYEPTNKPIVVEI